MHTRIRSAPTRRRKRLASTAAVRPGAPTWHTCAGWSWSAAVASSSRARICSRELPPCDPVWPERHHVRRLPREAGLRGLRRDRPPTVRLEALEGHGLVARPHLRPSDL